MVSRFVYQMQEGGRHDPANPNRLYRGAGDRTSMIAAGPRATRTTKAGELVEDRELLLRVQSGDAGAFDVLVQRYLPGARVLARRLMHDPDDADDLVQDAFLRALDRIAI